MLKITLKSISISIIIINYNKNESFETFSNNYFFNFSLLSFVTFFPFCDIKSSSPSGESKNQKILNFIFRFKKIKNKQS